MPHGYTCDRCETFVKQEGLYETTPNGPPEEVEVLLDVEDNHNHDLHRYTFCPRCRDELVRWVEVEP